MNGKITNHLFETYAPLFPPKEVREDETQSCLAYGFECADGWATLIEQCLRDLMHFPGVMIDQVKEKFGTLRIYWSDAGLSEEDYSRVSAVVDQYEEMAEHTCELCGKEGRITTIRGWHQTLCAECEEKLNH